MSQRALSQALFHGTGVIIQPGERVLPAVKHGGHSTWGDTGSEKGQPSREHAFATSDEGSAWYFAHNVIHDGDSASYGQRPRVYRVAPNPRMKPGVHDDLKEYIAPSFKVLDRIDIKPGQQGTLAGEGAGPYNWNQHKGPRAWEDVNHPEFVGEGTLDHQQRERTTDQNRALAQERAKQTVGEGQGELFHSDPYVNVDDPERLSRPGRPSIGTQVFTDHQRARHHLLRDLVNAGHTPALLPDRDLGLREQAVGQRLRESARNLPRWGG